MNKRITQILVAVFLTIAISTSTAQAGFVDWLKGNSSSATSQASQQDSSILSTLNDTDTDQLAVSGFALVGFGSSVNDSAKAPAKVSYTTYTVQVSAYNSEVGQTDDSPFITANGTHVRDGIVAANIIDASGRNIPFNTIIKFKNCGGIPSDKIFTVTDRLNKRYTKNVDIWMASHSDALKFGRKTCQIEVIK